jgi:hypothetical protein
MHVIHLPCSVARSPAWWGCLLACAVSSRPRALHPFARHPFFETYENPISTLHLAPRQALGPLSHAIRQGLAALSSGQALPSSAGLSLAIAWHSEQCLARAKHCVRILLGIDKQCLAFASVGREVLAVFCSSAVRYLANATSVRGVSRRRVDSHGLWGWLLGKSAAIYLRTRNPIESKREVALLRLCDLYAFQQTCISVGAEHETHCRSFTKADDSPRRTLLRSASKQ